jgi:hypothetical protein
MHTDHIVEEVRRARRAYAEKFDFDLPAIYRDLKAKEAANQRVVRLPQRRAEKKSSAKGEYA